MPQALVITRPFHDLTTSYLHRYSSFIVSYAKKKLRSVVNLEQKRANKNELESVIKKVKPEIILLYGHGDDNCVLGQEEVIVQAGDNEEILKDAIVYSLSCRSARVLGPSSISKGAKAYIGYKEDFIFPYTDEPEDSYSTRAEQDPLAKLFLEPTNRISMSLIDGYSPQDAHARGVSEFNKNLENVLLSNSTEEYVARFLVWDMVNQVCLEKNTDSGN